MREFCLTDYLSNGVERIVKGILKASLDDPKESIFMIRFAAAAKRGKVLRAQAEDRGKPVPLFLIASITSQCNLHCRGCYARANQTCGDTVGAHELTATQWGSIFSQAEELGISFILLAGGEPLTRPDLLFEAGRYKTILFPVFTNGTLLDGEGMKLFTACRNLIPILSIEGKREVTDRRRGEGIYLRLQQAMENLKERKLLFGASVTVTMENREEVLSAEFLNQLEERGCKAVIYVAYVPIDRKTKELALGTEEQKDLENSLNLLREQYPGLLFLSFPGDEKAAGGCLAAGRGFFHINAGGGAEPCPFSPYSDTSLLHTSLEEALQSPLFIRLRSSDIMMQDHQGGCVLFEQEEKVKEYLEDTKR